MSEHVHEMAEDVAQEAIELEKKQAAEMLDEAAAAAVAERDIASLALAQFFGPDQATNLRDAKNTPNWEERRSFILGLRGLADLYVAHPEMELPQYFGDFTIYNVPKTALLMYAKAFGSLEKIYSESAFQLKKDFGGGVRLATYSSRDAVCERVKVGEKLVPAHVVPAKPAEEARIIEERVDDIYEWICPDISLLRPAGEVEDEQSAATEAGVEFSETLVSLDDDIAF